MIGVYGRLGTKSSYDILLKDGIRLKPTDHDMSSFMGKTCFATNDVYHFWRYIKLYKIPIKSTALPGNLIFYY